MSNWEKPGNDMPSKEDVRRMEKADRRREQTYQRQQVSVNEYLMNHPSASLAEARYKTQKHLGAV